MSWIGTWWPVIWSQQRTEVFAAVMGSPDLNCESWPVAALVAFFTVSIVSVFAVVGFETCLLTMRFTIVRKRGCRGGKTLSRRARVQKIESCSSRATTSTIP